DANDKNDKDDGKDKNKDNKTSVAGYLVFRNGSQIAQVTGTSYSDTHLSPKTTYVYAVAAFDSSDNVSSLIRTVSAANFTAPKPPTISITSPIPNQTISGTI